MRVILVCLPCSRLQIVYDMEQAGVEPTAYTYTILLDCFAQRGKAFDGFQVIWPAPSPCAFSLYVFVCLFFFSLTGRRRVVDCVPPGGG